MFRQIPSKPFLQWETLCRALDHGDDWKRLARAGGFMACVVPGATLWGHVNYFFDGQLGGDATYTTEWGEYRGHGQQWHVVWQLEDALFRAVVCEKVPFWVREQRCHDTGQEDEVQALWAATGLPLITALPQLYIAV